MWHGMYGRGCGPRGGGRWSRGPFTMHWEVNRERGGPRGRRRMFDGGELRLVLLKLIADPTRLRIISALNTTELCVCDLAAAVGISESTVSHQLRLLRGGRVVAYRKAGRVAYYRLLDHHVMGMVQNALDHARE